MVVDVTELMATPDGHDEVGAPDQDIAKCECGVLFRRGSWHRCRFTDERVEWNEFIGEGLAVPAGDADD